MREPVQLMGLILFVLAVVFFAVVLALADDDYRGPDL